MKARQIKLHAELYYNTDNRWATGRGEHKRVVVVDPTVQSWDFNEATQEWERARWQSVGINPPGALVDIYRAKFDADGVYQGEEPVRRPVPVAHLRGPWDECFATHTAARAQHNEEWATHQRENALREAEGDAIVLIASGLGVRVGINARGGLWASVSGAAMAAMVAKLDEIGWRYENPEV